MMVTTDKNYQVRNQLKEARYNARTNATRLGLELESFCRSAFGEKSKTHDAYMQSSQWHGRKVNVIRKGRCSIISEMAMLRLFGIAFLSLHVWYERGGRAKKKRET